jgi:hypothetical protein
MKFNNTGLFQALGVVGYCSIIAFIMFNGGRIFGNMNNFFGPLAFLTMFSASVLVCGLFVFYKPYLLFFSEKKKEAIDIVFSTAVYLFIFLAIFFGILFLTK